MTSIETIRLIETLALRAWPPQVGEPLDGWVLRKHAAPSRRVNSVWPNGWGGALPLARKLELAEAFYARHAQPAVYQISPACQPAGLDEALEARGYAAESQTAVQTCEVGLAIERVRDLAGSTPPIEISETLTDHWLHAYIFAQHAALDEIALRRETLVAIRRPTAYALAVVDGVPAAVGRGVLDGGWLGIFGMATHSEYRRRGLARGILGALAGWAQARAAVMYLQVMESNPGARALYEQIGFRTLYHYHYRQQAPSTD
jgi:ribosomal protein S18 acetylase RimI-like enzyme